MANNISLKTYKGKSVSPQDDAIIYETAIPSNGVFKGCNVSYARGNVLRVSQGFGMIKGRFFEIYESEVDVRLADGDATLDGRIYLHMDLSNTDEPIQILTETGSELAELVTDEDVNYNNTAYDLEIATFTVTSSELSNLQTVVEKIEAGAGGSASGAKETVNRNTEYVLGDMTRAATAPGWVTLVCVTAGVSALTVPAGYAKITKAGDTVTDGTCVFKAYNLITDIETLQTTVAAIDEEVESIKASLGNTGGLQTVVCSVSEYTAMEGWDDNTIYLCYEDADSTKITRIYKGEARIFSNSVTVTYQADTGESSSKTLMEKDDVIALAPTVNKEGYIFGGWRSDTTPSGVVLSEYIIDQETALTFYAVFKKEIEIGMHPASGKLLDGKQESTIKTNCFYNNGTSKSEEVVIPDGPYEKENMSFVGWTCAGEFYKPGTKNTFTDDGTLLAAYIDTVYDFPYTGNYAVFNIPADGIYEFEVWGGEGGEARYSSQYETAKGGKGGHAKGYKRMKKGEIVYVYNGGKGDGNYGGTNGGTGGSNYANSKWYGGGGGGATHIAYNSGAIGSTGSGGTGLNYANRDKFLIIAGGGGGGAMKMDTSYKITEQHEGGAGGGDRGEDGSGGALGGRQVSTGTSESSGFGAITLSYSSSYCYAGGGAGWFAGAYARDAQSAAGGSGYVGGVADFTYKKKYYSAINEVGINEGNGKSFIRYVTVD